MSHREVTMFIYAVEAVMNDVTLYFGGRKLSRKIARVTETANDAGVSEETAPLGKALAVVFDAINSASSSPMSREEWMDIIDNVEMFIDETSQTVSLDESDKDDSYEWETDVSDSYESGKGDSYEWETSVSHLIGSNIARLRDWMVEIAYESGDYIQFTAIE